MPGECLGSFKLGKVYCMKNAVGFKQLPDECVDLIIVDIWGGCNDWIAEAFRVLVSTGAVLVLVQLGVNDIIERVDKLVEEGFVVKESTLNYDLEDAADMWLVASKPGGGHIRFPSESPVLYYKRPFPRFHEAERNILTMESFVKGHSPENGIVLDPFAGTGAAGVACLRCGRKFLGFEAVQKRTDEANKRLGEEEVRWLN